MFRALHHIWRLKKRSLSPTLTNSGSGFIEESWQVLKTRAEACQELKKYLDREAGGGYLGYHDVYHEMM